MTERFVTSVVQGKDSIIFNFNDGEFAVFAKFGKDIYTSTSPNTLKKTLVNIKEDIKEIGFNAEILEKLWKKK